MSRVLVVALLAWTTLSLVWGMGLGGPEKKGATILVYPLLWVVGAVMWVIYFAADRLHLARNRNEAR